MKMPPGFDEENSVLKLEKALYGLKQAGRQWYLMLKRFLEDNEYKPTTADPCLYYKREQDDLTLIGVYVDDIVVAGTKENVKSFYNLLKSEFTVRDLGEVKYHLGIQFHRESDGSIFPYQQKFVVEVLERFKSHLEKKHQVDIPMKPLTRDINDPLLFFSKKIKN
jgi:hypothetical protein